jgi:hypothetical protein
MKFIVAIVLLVSVASCSLFKPKPDGTPTACSSLDGSDALKDVSSVILGVIVGGLTSGFSTGSMIAALESLAVEYAPAFWKCAMQAVASGKADNPMATAAPAGIAAIAQLYLDTHK